MTLKTNFIRSLQRENGTLLMTKIMDSTVKETRNIIKPNLCDYSDACILVTGDIKVAAVAADTNVGM